ncbi:tetratricopeptide repeat protein [Parasphingorhabdus litoris]|uniref:Tetratricopeptide repeat protein n=1 Tax=Parasphingorhabdus litoris TaxID=394733 RepID=A0ABP3KM48_9SPHN|nr:tetratricopeptide repeat protein [Parasphingorhabdus litoris]
MEVPIIRICKISAFGILAVALAGSAAHAKRSSGAEGLNQYVEARLAESVDNPAVAAAIYADSLKSQPDNLLLAGKAYVKAIEAGKFDLAVKAVRSLDLRGQVEPEMPFLLFADAFARNDYKAAATASIELEALGNFAFLSPFLDAWIARATGESPLIGLAAAEKDKTAAYYHLEQFILQGLAGGNDLDIIPLLDKIVEANEARMGPVRIIAARHFLARKDTARAVALLKNERTGPEAKMLEDIRSGNIKKLAQKVNADIGLAFLFQRLSSDLRIQRADFLALIGAQAALRILPNNDYGHLVLGEAFSESQNGRAAKSEFKKISYDSAFSLLAISKEIASYAEENDYDGGQVRLNQIIDQDPETPQLQILLGQLLQMSGDHRSAADAFKRAISLAERRDFSDAVLANYWLSLGSAQEQAGLWPAGLESLKKANILQPDSASILNYLGYAQLERRENTASAMDAIRKAYKMRSSSPAITDSLGWAYFIVGEHEKAVNYLERARAGEPQDPTINEHLGDAYWTVGRKYEARYAWKSAKLFADAEDMQRLADKIDLGLRADLVSP